MCRARSDELLEEDVGDAEGGAGLAPGLVERRRRAGRRSATTRMPRPPPPIDALTMTGIAELLGERLRLGDRSSTGSSLPDEDRHAGLLGDLPGGDLVAELVEDLRARADEGDARLVAGAGELGVLGQEAVAGVDRVDLVLPAPARRCRRCPGRRGSARPACRPGRPRRP